MISPPKPATARRSTQAVLVLALWALFLLASCQAPAARPRPASVTQAAQPATLTSVSPLPGQPAAVLHIVDGDTIDVTFGGHTHRVRYILINTPETDQPFGAEATAANRALVGGRTVYLVKDKSETDRYGRLLRYVYLPDGAFVNAELVRQGFAQVATYPPDVSKEAELRAVEAAARTARRGLWATGVAAFGPASAVARGAATLRQGPGFQYPAAGAVAAGQALAVVGQDASGAWLQLAGGQWIMAVLVAGAPTNLPVAAQASAAGLPRVAITAVDKQAEYVELCNEGVIPVALTGWVLRSELGRQDCPLAGVLAPGRSLRVWAQTGADGYSCGFPVPVWSNSRPDPAVLLAPGGMEVARWAEAGSSPSTER